MAKFGSYFGLCPLIDHRSLLGISRDAEDGKVLVTLGGNIAMQYQLADQKQILSWTTKDKFTSPVIYDFDTEKYVACFNQMWIRCWSIGELNPDKVKAIKFKTLIHTITIIDQTSFVIFQNGAIETLKLAMTNHKTLIPIKIVEDHEYVRDIVSCSMDDHKYIGLFIANSTSTEITHLALTVFSCQEGKFKSSRLNLKRNNCEIVGYTFHLSEQEVYLFTLWSDGKLYCKSFESNSEDPGEIFSVIESVSCNDPVSLISLDKDYIALYGNNRNQEGALLAIYNMQFKITQCRQSFKLSTKGAKLWPTQDKLILPVGQNLAVVPYHLEKEQLSALVGSHKVLSNKNEEEDDVAIVPNLEHVTWSKHPVPSKDSAESWKEIAAEYLDQGYCEFTILEELIPGYIEENNLECLKLLLEHSDDIPDKYIADLLQYVLDLHKEFFKNSKPHSDKSYPQKLQPYQRGKLLEIILKKRVNEVYLIPYLRVKLNFDNVLALLSFLLFLLEFNITDTGFVNKLIDWICIILDAKYQSFILSKDEQVEKLLLWLSDFVNGEITSLENLHEVLCIVKQLGKQKSMNKILDTRYTVEKIVL